MAILKATNPAPFVKRFLLSYRGNWNLPWVIQRYLRTSFSGVTVNKLANTALAMIEMSIGKTHVMSNPFVLRIEPTNVCNLHCPRCSCGIDTDPRKKGYISMDDYRLILEENRKNAIIVRLDGNGEPTLHPEIFELIKMAKSYGYSVSMSTNLNTDCCDNVERFLDSKLDRLIVPIDGSTQTTHEKYRVGGNLALVEKRLVALLTARRKSQATRPFIEVQFLDWDYNHDDIPKVRDKVRRWEADKLEIISPDWAVTNAHANPHRPRRCF